MGTGRDSECVWWAYVQLNRLLHSAKRVCVLLVCMYFSDDGQRLMPVAL